MAQQPMLRGNGYAISRDLNPKLVRIDELKPLGRATRKHPPAQVRKLERSIAEFGFVLPIVIDDAKRVVAGWGLVLASRKLGLNEIPAITITDLTEAKLRTLRLALNRLGEDSDWDHEAVKLEFSDILEIDSTIELDTSGFEIGEIDLLLDGNDGDEEDTLPPPDATAPITRPGDLWLLGEHRVLCADAREPQTYQRLLEQERVQMAFIDPPFHPIEGNASGVRAVMHSAEFERFLATSLGIAARHSEDGAIHFVCMHWSELRELLAATKEVYSELKDLCVWSKSDSGIGALYRPRHELVFVFKTGNRPHINNIAGRNRTNVWDYPAQTTFQAASKNKRVGDPKAKPVSLVMDAIRDCSNRNGIVLDPFGGPGTTLIAAEKTGRKARLIEIDPHYVDVTLTRWQRLTRRKAVRIESKASQLESTATPIAE
jgi:16S rRNA G966 N2-methylase RsmD